MRKTQFVPDHLYHIYNRGVNREPIFYSRANKLFFLKRLRKYFITDKTASIIAYCLMDNHFHLLIQTHIEQFGQKVMQPFSVSYTKAVNKEQERVGPLFQGPFKAQLVDNDAYVIWLSRYIHLNPVTAQLVDHPAKWEFSSYSDYVGLRDGKLPQKRVVLELFDSPEQYEAFVTGEDTDSGFTFPDTFLFD